MKPVLPGNILDDLARMERDITRLQNTVRELVAAQRGNTSTERPAAAAARNWIWVDSSTNAAYFSDGTSWFQISAGTP